MTLNLYQVYDTVAQTMMGPIIQAKHDAPAIRTFTDALSDPRALGAHAKDYRLMILGEQHEETGLLVPHPLGPQTVATGEQWLASQTPSA